MINTDTGVLQTVDKRLQDYGLTIMLAAVLMVWYVVQLFVWNLYDDSFFQWLFTFESLTGPTPGWILSTFSHGYPGHLYYNVGMLLVFGGFAEPHLRRREYLVFFIVVGSAASFVNLVFRPEDAPSVGASGAIYGLVLYSLYHYVRNHDDQLLPTTSIDGRFGWVRTLLKSVMVSLGFLLVSLQTLLELVGILHCPTTSQSTEAEKYPHVSDGENRREWSSPCYRYLAGSATTGGASCDAVTEASMPLAISHRAKPSSNIAPGTYRTYTIEFTPGLNSSTTMSTKSAG